MCSGAMVFLVGLGQDRHFLLFLQMPMEFNLLLPTRVKHAQVQLLFQVVQGILDVLTITNKLSLITQILYQLIFHHFLLPS